MNLTQYCDNAIGKYKLFTKKDKLLLACSGGKDSVALFHYLHNKGYDYEVAHINYMLREKSMEDENLVKTLCTENNIKFHLFQVKKAVIPSSNIQEWARNIRYEYFNQVIDRSNRSQGGKPIDYIVIAHSLNDFLESYLMNLGKGRNIWHNAGIAIKPGIIRRPLLLTTSKDVYSYLHKNKYLYHEDFTNSSGKYERNRVRLHILPRLVNEFPDIYAGARKILHNDFLKSCVTHYTYEKLKSEYMSYKNDTEIIEIPADFNENVFLSFLFEIFLPYGFHPTQIDNLFHASTGRVVISETHEALKDRNKIHVRKVVLQKIATNYKIEVPLPLPGQLSSVLVDKKFRFTLKEMEADVKHSASGTEYISLDKKQFPLEIRRWEDGDRFTPLGMKGSKKIKSFLTDLNVNLWEKGETYILTDSKGEILWVIPYRISEKVKITETRGTPEYYLTWGAVWD